MAPDNGDSTALVEADDEHPRALHWQTKSGTFCRLGVIVYGTGEMQFDLATCENDRPDLFAADHFVCANLTVAAAEKLRDLLDAFISERAKNARSVPDA